MQTWSNKEYVGFPEHVSDSGVGHARSSKPVYTGSRTRLLFPTKLPLAAARAPLTLG